MIKCNFEYKKVSISTMVKYDFDYKHIIGLYGYKA